MKLYCIILFVNYNVWLFQLDALEIFDGGKRTTEGTMATAGIWSTYPFSDGKRSISNWAGFGDQVESLINFVN